MKTVRKMKNIILVVMVLVVFSGCTAVPKSEIQTSGVQPTFNASESKEIAIESVIFTRTGIAVNTDEAIPVTTITISGNGAAVKKNIDSTTNSFVLDIAWTPDTRYSIEIASKEANISYSAYSPGRASPLLINEVKLEDINPENISQGWSNVKGSVEFSPDGKFIALGSETGFVRIFDSLGNKIWEKEITGNISDVAFSPDSGRLFVGERSSNAYVYSFDVKSGEELWKYRTADDIGTDVKYQPAVYRIKVTDNSIYAAASRYWKNGKYSLASRVYRFEPNGNLVWKLPSSKNYDLSINWLDASRDGKTIVFAMGDWTNSLEADATVYSIDESSNTKWSYTIKPLKPYFTSAAIWQGIAISDDSITALTGDGRAYLFNDTNASKTGSYEWKRDISTPIEVSKIPIYAYGDSAGISGENILYLTGYTFATYYPKKALIEHPNATSLVVYDKKGNFSWQYKVEGYSKAISTNDRYVVIPVGKNIITKDAGVHGVYVFDLEKKGGASSKLEWVYRTEGVVVAADISPDGKYMAAIEAPVKLESGEIIGKHRMIILT